VQEVGVRWFINTARGNCKLYTVIQDKEPDVYLMTRWVRGGAAYSFDMDKGRLYRYFREVGLVERLIYG